MKWTCQGCGYRMNAQECLEEAGATPGEGDLSVCMNCGAYYIFRGGQWIPLSSEGLAGLDKETRSQLEVIRRGIREVITEDLAFNQRLKRKLS